MNKVHADKVDIGLDGWTVDEPRHPQLTLSVHPQPSANCPERKHFHLLHVDTNCKNSDSLHEIPSSFFFLRQLYSQMGKLGKKNSIFIFFSSCRGPDHGRRPSKEAACAAAGWKTQNVCCCCSHSKAEKPNRTSPPHYLLFKTALIPVHTLCMPQTFLLLLKI